MNIYTHTLTDIEIACGVTLEQVQQVLPRVLLRDGGARVVMPIHTPPALASSVARCAFSGAEAEFAGTNALGNPVYRRVEA